MPSSSSAPGERSAEWLQRADIVLLDEPTTGLDAATRALVAEVLIAERARGATVICVSHDDTTLAAADRLITLDAGRICPTPSISGISSSSSVAGVSVMSAVPALSYPAETDEAAT
ncbi:hypothetical protein ASF21_16120 [Arthrobacter sp. Leaf234]|uniref:ATP-binding cassette domain-containing protein n=1 Tax=Arthrobacter sp. Leaf234 TaxID=1736303 RepID=UPI0006F3EE1F|nr:ABC transporter ATP-binding protein [Arthrobacter sp. Leaf234]KQO02149.1 hypothetical protein ASF21_16120 [Arthrobacter sp. Leaf234]